MDLKTIADSGEGERLFRRERERHSGPKANSARSVATLALRLCRKCSASSRKTVRSEAEEGSAQPTEAPASVSSSRAGGAGFGHAALFRQPASAGRPPR